MKPQPVSPIHISWVPGSVQAVNTATGERGQAATIADLRSLWNGQRSIVVGIGRSIVFLKAVRLPKAAPDDLRRILGVQMAQLFPLPPDQLSYDFIQTDDRDHDGNLTIVGAMRSEDLRLLRAELQSAGVSAERILPLALAAPIAAAHARQTDALVAASDSSGMALDVVRAGTLRFSRLVAKESDLQVEALRTMAAAQAGNLQVVTAGSVSLPDAIASDGDYLSLLGEAPPFVFELSEDREKAVKQRISNRTRLAALMLVSAILLVLLVWMDRSEKAATVARTEASRARQIKKLQDRKTVVMATQAAALDLQQTLHTAMEPAQPLSDIIAYVSDRVPTGAWLTGVGLERGKGLQIRGTAKTPAQVNQLVTSLGGSNRFRDVKLVFASSGTIANTPVVQFNITAVAIGNIPMPTPPKPKAVIKKPASTTTASAATGAAQ